jgi:5S rRNA maturation endonuclease (ribonuclease M5)
MNADQGKQFLKALGVHDLTQSEKWLRAKCPLSPWTHTKGHDTMPSFGLTIDKSKHSTYHCFACSTGSPEELIQQLEMLSGYGSSHPGRFNFGKAREVLENEKLQVVPLPEYSEFGASDAKTFVPWEPDVFEAFPPASSDKAALDYLAYRAIDPLVADCFDLRVDHQRSMLVCPYRDVYGRPAGARGRLMDFGEEHNHLKHYDYTLGQNNAIFCWFNEQCMNLPGPILVVEGQFDAMRLAPFYPKVVANMTAKPSKRKLEKLAYNDRAIIFTDNDLPGQEASAQWTEELQKLQVQVGVVDWTGAAKSSYHIQRDGPGEPKDPDETDISWMKSALCS